jgi:hypothetical protein
MIIQSIPMAQDICTTDTITETTRDKRHAPQKKWSAIYLPLLEPGSKPRNVSWF